MGAADFPAQQGRAAFAVLVGERDGRVARGVLVEALWPGGPPRSGPAALNSLISKLRSLLSRAGVDGSAALAVNGGCYELRLPPGSWVDHEVAMDSIHEAEAALRAGDPARAYGPSAVAHHIARRAFLPEETGRWFESRRDRLAGVLVRALECRAEVYLWNGEHSLAAEAAHEVIALHPFRETGYRLLMRALVAMGNGAEALRVYERCRSLIAEELGVGPSRQTRAVHAEILRSM